MCILVLAKAGKKVLGLEAQGRIGGRVHTVPFGDGLVELGAEWIHGTESSSTYELAIKNNVSILAQDSSVNVYFSDGSSDKEAIVEDITKFALEVVDDQPEKPESWGQYVSRRSSWFSNPFTRGSYTYDSVETPQHPTARADLATPLRDSAGEPRLLFAGEATDTTHFSTVHGAVDTGYMKANRILTASSLITYLGNISAKQTHE